MDIRITNAYKTFEVYKSDGVKTSIKAGKADEKKDVIALSPESKFYQVAQKAISELPDIREDKITQLRSKIDSNLFNINADAIADKLLSL